MKARWHNMTIVASETWVEPEGNIYFPLSSVRQDYLVPSSTTTVCSWKGTAYYDVVGEGETNKDAAWFYSQPNAAAKNIKNYIAFWGGIEVMD